MTEMVLGRDASCYVLLQYDTVASSVSHSSYRLSRGTSRPVKNLCSPSSLLRD